MEASSKTGIDPTVADKLWEGEDITEKDAHALLRQKYERLKKKHIVLLAENSSMKEFLKQKADEIVRLETALELKAQALYREGRLLETMMKRNEELEEENRRYALGCRHIVDR